jgi:glutathione S-transferase
MKLYMSARAPNPRRVAMFAAEKGLQIQEEMVDIMAGQHRSEDYLAKNPLGRVPALELDDGRVLCETRAICTYLEGLRPEPNLMGEGFEERAFIEMADRRMELHLFMPIAFAARHTHPALAVLETPQPQVAEYNRAGAEKFMKTLDRRLADTEFIADRFTIADIVAVVGLDFGRVIRYRPPAELENLARWLETCRARPAAKAGA